MTNFFTHKKKILLIKLWIQIETETKKMNIN